MSNSESGFLPVENGTLYYEVSGAGHPLVLIHAGVADLSMWDEQVAAFAPQYRVIRYDTRGYGKTRTEAGPYSNRQDLRDLLDHLGVDRAYVLGLSRGGQIAVDFTVEFPERVAALIPVAAGLSGFEGDVSDEEPFIAAMEAAWEARDFERLTDLDVRLWGDGPGQPEGRAPQPVREQLRRMILNNYRVQTVEGQPRPLDPPANGRLGDIHVPTLVMIGDLDTILCLAVADRLAEGIHGARKVVFPGVAHMVNLERPAEFNRLVLEFLGALN
jgi:3-oxoadipate enol-lactonase